MKSLIKVGALFALGVLVLFLSSISMMAAMVVGGIAFIGLLVWLILD